MVADQTRIYGVINDSEGYQAIRVEGWRKDEQDAMCLITIDGGWDATGQEELNRTQVQELMRILQVYLDETQEPTDETPRPE